MTVIHADCREVLPTLEKRSVAAIITDPPYSAVNNNGGRGDGRENDKGRPNDGESLDIEWLASQFCRICSGSIYVWCSSEQVSQWRRAFIANRWTTRQCVWVKSNPSPANGESLWLSGVELCVFARRPKVTFNRVCELPVWNGPSERVKGFPCPKPVWLMKELVDASTGLGDSVLDPFAGSGTVGVACRELGREFCGIEREEAYYHLASNRIAGSM